jgi:2'-5' RNA ligase
LSGGRPQTPAHITLAPPTEIDDADLPDVVAHLDVRVRGTGTFRPVSPVVFVGVVAGIGGCEELAGRVRSGPLRSRPSFPYHPHVTIAHGLSDDLLDRAFEEQAGFDASWPVESFTLYERTPASTWTPSRELTLGR